MKVLVACEYSGRVRDAFIKLGHDAWSCDLLPCEGDNYKHMQGDVLQVLSGRWYQPWDLIIAHPPCTHLAVSGSRWFKDKQVEQEEALEFVRKLMAAPAERICIENPVSIISGRIRKPDQIINPYQFGHPEKKRTCLWLKNLPKLVETNNVKEDMLKLEKKEQNRVHYMGPGPERWKERSRTFQGIADAMAQQWSNLNG